MKKVLFIIVIILLLIAFGVSAFMVGSYLLEGKEQKDRYDELAQMVADATPSTETTEATQATAETETTETTVSTEPTEPVMKEEYVELYEMNSDFAGWLEIPNTNLKYPVMHTPENPNYYLYRDFDKKDSKRGSIYAREECDLLEPSDNITLYGHNMADGSMFATLNNYTRQGYCEENSLIIFNTLYEYHTYKIFAVFKTSANLGQGFSYHQFVDAEDEAEFNEFVSTCKDLSFYDTGITPKYGDKLICLSTCEYTLDNGRLVVAAVRIT